MRAFLMAAAVLFTVVYAAGGAGADGGPSPGVVNGWGGVVSPNGKLRYATFSRGAGTLVAVIRTHGGNVEGSTWLRGNYGVPLVTYGGTAGGLTRDGRTLVLASPFNGTPVPGTTTRFAFLGTQNLRLGKVVSLRGSFSFDALSPGGGTMYLIQYLPSQGSARYLVRAYDLHAGRLLPLVIADRREPGPMSGSPIARATSARGDWVYTLYVRQRGRPFVHALDTAHRSAVCVDLPWPNAEQKAWKVRLALDARRRLVLREPHVGRLALVDTRTFRVWSFRPPR